MQEGTNHITTFCANRSKNSVCNRTQATSSAGGFDLPFTAQQLCEAELLLGLLAVGVSCTARLVLHRMGILLFLCQHPSCQDLMWSGRRKMFAATLTVSKLTWSPLLAAALKQQQAKIKKNTFLVHVILC